MSLLTVDVSKEINARPQDVYAVIADYKVGHPAILPKPYFTELTVEEGGQGAGTVLRLRMNVYGQEFHYHQIVTEPEPGRVLVETDLDTGLYSKFIFEPLDGGQRTRVTISAQFKISAGLKGLMERLFTPMVVRGIFNQELDNLAAYVRRQPAPVGIGLI